MRSSDLVHSFEDGMKLKMSSENTPPLTVHCRWKLEKKVKGVLRGHNRGMTFILRTQWDFPKDSEPIAKGLKSISKSTQCPSVCL
jgi:hypothetical protein